MRAYVDPQRNQEWALKEIMASGDYTILIYGLKEENAEKPVPAIITIQN